MEIDDKVRTHFHEYHNKKPMYYSRAEFDGLIDFLQTNGLAICIEAMGITHCLNEQKREEQGEL